MRWLEAGATGSYGTVVEPCAITQKFPNPAVVIGRYLLGRDADRGLLEKRIDARVRDIYRRAVGRAVPTAERITDDPVSWIISFAIEEFRRRADYVGVPTARRAKPLPDRRSGLAAAGEPVPARAARHERCPGAGRCLAGTAGRGLERSHWTCAGRRPHGH